MPLILLFQTITDVNDDEAVRELTVRILTGSRSSLKGGSVRERLLHVEVTDEAEPYFLFTLDVGEDDFHELKRDQVPSISLLFLIDRTSPLL